MEQKDLGDLQLWHCQCWKKNIFFGNFPKWNPWDFLYIFYSQNAWKDPQVYVFCDTWQPIHDIFWSTFHVKKRHVQDLPGVIDEDCFQFLLCDALRRVMGVRQAPFIVNSGRIALTSGLRIGGASTRKAGWFALVHLKVKVVTLLVGLMWGRWS